MTQPIPTEYQRPPEDEDVTVTTTEPQQYGPTKEATLTLRRKEGHCILELSRGPGEQNMIWTQSAGNELEDAFQKAKNVWKLAECVPVSRTKYTEKWTVKFEN